MIVWTSVISTMTENEWMRTPTLSWSSARCRRRAAPSATGKGRRTSTPGFSRSGTGWPTNAAAGWRGSRGPDVPSLRVVPVVAQRVDGVVVQRVDQTGSIGLNRLERLALVDLAQAQRVAAVADVHLELGVGGAVDVLSESSCRGGCARRSRRRGRSCTWRRAAASRVSSSLMALDLVHIYLPRP